jgi:hypothetical protein
MEEQLYLSLSPPSHEASQFLSDVLLKCLMKFYEAEEIKEEKKEH